ncbi:MAG: thiamine diphosphokinase [Candidatus Zixiibacteriota bacterium]
MPAAAIFLNGSYPNEHIGFYRRIIESSKGKRLLVAADGGLLLFDQLGLRPDLIIGDFDSVDAATLAKYSGIEIVRFPNNKDATDGELALRAAVQRGCSDIEIYGAIDMRYETDHLLANLFLLKLARRIMPVTTSAATVRATDHRQHIYLIENEELALGGRTGDFISILALSQEITVSIKGVEWELDRQKVEMGASWTLRNQFAGEKVDISLTGAGLVVHRHS